MIAAHGDCGGERGNVLAIELARRMRLSRRYQEVVVGYMKSAPTIEEAAARIGAERIRLLPLFMSDGYYVREAIPRRLGIHDGVRAMHPARLHQLLAEGVEEPAVRQAKVVDIDHKPAGVGGLH